jgi:hypothetical protein
MLKFSLPFEIDMHRADTGQKLAARLSYCYLGLVVWAIRPHETVGLAYMPSPLPLAALDYNYIEHTQVPLHRSLAEKILGAWREQEASLCAMVRKNPGLMREQNVPADAVRLAMRPRKDIDDCIRNTEVISACSVGGRLIMWDKDINYMPGLVGNVSVMRWERMQLKAA